MKLRDIRLVSEDSALGRTSVWWRFGIAVTFVGVVIYIVGFSTDYWAKLDNEDYAPVPGAKINGHFGLWRKCITIYVNKSKHYLVDGCTDMDNDHSYKPAAKSMCSIGLIICIFALPIAILAGCSLNPRVMALAGALTICGATGAMIGCAVYIGKAKDDDDRLDLDYSAFLAIVGNGLLLTGGICQLLSIRTGYHTLA